MSLSLQLEVSMSSYVLHRLNGVRWLVAMALLVAALATAGRAAAQAITAAGASAPRFLFASASTGQRVEVDASAVQPLRQRVSLELAGATVASALKAIGQQTGILFTYDPAVMPADRRITVRAEGLTLSAALTEVLTDSGLDVLVADGKHLAIVPRHVPAPPPTGTVIGRVSEAKGGAPVTGAEVLLEGTRWRAIAGEGGRFRLAEVEVGSYTLVVRHIGYVPARRAVTIAADQEVSVDVVLEPAPSKLNELVVTGTVIPTEVKALPTPVSVISAQDLEGRYVQNIGEMLRQVVPGAASPVIVSNPRQTALSLRGASQIQSGAGMVKVYLDGIEVTDFSMASVDPSSIERIEVIRGPQAAALYGSDAMGGVMQIFTKRGDPALTKPQLEIEAALGAAEKPYDSGASLWQQYRMAVSGGTGDASYRLGAGYKRVGEWMPHYYQHEPTVHAAARLARGPITVDVTGRYEQTNYRVDDVGNPILRETGDPYFTNVQYTDNRVKNVAQTLAAAVRYSPAAWWRHELVVGRDHSDFSSKSHFPRRAYPGDDNLMISTSNESKTSINYTTSIAGALGTGLSGSVTAGVAHYFFSRAFWYTDGAITTEGSIKLAPGAYVGPSLSNVRNTGYFAQGQFALRESLFLTAGLRWEHNTNFGDDLSPPVTPRVGLSYVRNVGPATVKARAAYGEAIRPPSVGMKDVDVTPYAHRAANPDLAPERQTGWDGGVDVHFGARASIGVTYYRQRAKDLIQQVWLDDIDGLPTYQYQNVARVNNTGWEFEGTLRLGALRVNGQYAITRSRVGELGSWYTGSLEPGEQIHTLPKATGGLSADLTLGAGTTISSGLTYVGSQRSWDYVSYYRCTGGTGPCLPSVNDFLMDYPEFVKVNLGITQPVRRGVVGFVRVENLTGVIPGEFSNFYPDAGRTAIAGLRVTP